MAKDINLSENLRRLMKAHNNLNEAELAAATGVPQPTLNHILNLTTKRPRRDCLTKLANFFGISIQQLLGEASFSIPKNAEVLKNVPLIQWSEVINFTNKSTENGFSNTTVCDIPVSHQSFALTMNDCSMSPLFPEKTILIFDMQKQPYDRGYGLFILGKEDIVFRQVILDGTNKLIKALNPDLGDFIKKIDKHDRFIASLVQAKMDFLK